ncbi:MAG: ferrous iron transport protein A [Firmicutes bacterium]|nr:ferrous iron transport protein A [Bacillota bacterium]
MKLSDARRSDVLTVTYFPSGTPALQARRLGLSAGSNLCCIFVLPGGPVVIRLQRQMIAIGRSLADGILVEVSR